MSYSIILPAYREAKNLDIIIDQIQNFMKGEIFEIIVVDDFSDDGTEQILKRKQRKKKKNIWKKVGKEKGKQGKK